MIILEKSEEVAKAVSDSTKSPANRTFMHCHDAMGQIAIFILEEVQYITS